MRILVGNVVGRPEQQGLDALQLRVEYAR